MSECRHCAGVLFLGFATLFFPAFVRVACMRGTVYPIPFSVFGLRGKKLEMEASR